MYNSTIPTEAADRLNNTNPFAVSELTTLAGLHFQAEKEPERFEALQRVGFKADPFGNLTYQMYQKFGGHYMDVGACAKIASGLVGSHSHPQFGTCRISLTRIRSKSNPTHFQWHTLQTVLDLAMAPS